MVRLRDREFEDWEILPRKRASASKETGQLSGRLRRVISGGDGDRRGPPRSREGRTSRSKGERGKKKQSFDGRGIHSPPSEIRLVTTSRRKRKPGAHARGKRSGWADGVNGRG